MAQFLKGNQLNAELEKLFDQAESQLIVISPYIKLHSRFRDALKAKKDNPRLDIIFVFGKNEDDISKSLNNDDFEFLKEFPCVEIKYEPRLHAKYYANEYSSILSSMNLYDFSQNNNIEFGILTNGSLLSGIKDALTNDKVDGEALDYFFQVIKNAETVYRSVPVFESKMLGMTKKYTHSEVEIDELSGKFGKNKSFKSSSHKTSFQKPSISYSEPEIKEPGYCIRTGDKIPFNPERPLSYPAFKEWNKYKDENFKEKFCHFSGELSHGETSVKQPVLKRNWTKAQKQVK